jgi:hypothetical protein
VGAHRVLDLGCGDGRLLAALARPGHFSTGGRPGSAACCRSPTGLMCAR